MEKEEKEGIELGLAGVEVYVCLFYFIVEDVRVS